MSYRWVDHTAEVELEIEATSEWEVLEGALRALAELLGTEPVEGEETRSVKGEETRSVKGEETRSVKGEETRSVKGEETRSVALEAGDRPALLAAWIEELAFLAESEGFVATRVVDLALGTDRLHATVCGVLSAPPPLVKAVTYHRLAFERRGDGYVGRVVLDV